MTTRHAGYVVTLAENIRDDDAEATINALKQIKGVIDVNPVDNDPVLILAEARARREIQEKLYDFCRDISNWKTGAQTK